MSQTAKQDKTTASGGGETYTDNIFERFETEHIYIEDVLADATEQPRTVAKQLRIHNRIRGTVTELTFYDEGFLRVREGTPKKLHKDYVLELRFVDARPERRRHAAVASLWTMIGSLGVGLGALVVLPLIGLATYSFAATTLLGTIAAVALMLFIYKSVECTRFCTASGRADVLTLVASPGCITKMRRAAREIQRAIGRVVGDGSGLDERYLRAEMQAHYRLREKGVISQEACSDGTAQILAKFG